MPRIKLPRLAMLLATPVIAALVAGCAQIKGSEPPPAVTAQAHEIRSLYDIVLVLAAVIFFAVEGAIVYAVVRYRRKPTDTELPPQVHGNNLVEVVWTVIPTVIVAVMFILSWQTLNNVDAVSATPQLRVRAVAAQFQWEFQYLSPDGQTVVLDQANPVAPDGGLVVPVGVNVQLSLKSKDVIHAFYVPKFLFKRDVVPGRENIFDFTVDPSDVGQTFNGQCAELCGTFHESMHFSVRAMSQTDFDAWLKGQVEAAKNTPPPPPSGPPAGATITETAKGVAFQQTALSAPPDKPFDIMFDNQDAGTPHNIVIKDSGGQTVFDGGKPFNGVAQMTYHVPALKAGSYPFVCVVHPNMTGTLTVQ